MTYSKPEVTSMTKAHAAIQRSSEKGGIHLDADPNLGDTAVSPAYEADE
jgi:hypothetical protein